MLAGAGKTHLSQEGTCTLERAGPAAQGLEPLGPGLECRII